MRTVRPSVVETMTRFYCWIREGKPYCTWLAYHPDAIDAVDCTEMNDDEFFCFIEKLGHF